MASADGLTSQLAEYDERRAKKRFPVEQEVRYSATMGPQVRETGTGKTINISSSGVSFTAQNMLPIGTRVELSINWPVLLSDTCPMKLMIHGQVVRCSDQAAVIATERYEFRTRARPPIPGGSTSGTGPK